MKFTSAVAAITSFVGSIAIVQMARKVVGASPEKQKPTRKSPAAKRKTVAKKTAKRVAKATSRKVSKKKAAAPKRRATVSKPKLSTKHMIRQSKAKSLPTANVKHPGMMDDGIEEQNLNQTGNPKARMTKHDRQAAAEG